MEASYAEQYAILYHGHWWWRSREALLVDLLRRHLSGRRVGPILDVGCGDGLFFPRLREFGEPQGIEVDPRTVSDGGRQLGPIHIGSLDQTFQPEHLFGLVVAADVIEHVEDDAAFLRRIWQLTSPGGHLLLTAPALPLLWTHHDRVNEHHRRYHRHGLVELLGGAGYRHLEVRFIFTWMVLPKLAVRATEALSPPCGVPGSTKIPWAPLNRLAMVISLAEQRLTRSIGPPLGSSLVAWAQRDP